MKIRTLVASLALAVSGSAMAATDLGVLDAGGSSFSKDFWRVFGIGSTLGAFVDHYTFTLNGAVSAEGATMSMDWGSLDLDLTKVTLSGGTIDGKLKDATPDGFSFSGLGAGTYKLDIAGNLKNVGGPLGYASYTGSIHSVASPAPEPAVLAMVLAGLAGVSLLARRGRQD